MLKRSVASFEIILKLIIPSLAWSFSVLFLLLENVSFYRLRGNPRVVCNLVSLNFEFDIASLDFEMVTEISNNRKTSTRRIPPNAVMRLNGCPLRQEINRRWSR